MSQGGAATQGLWQPPPLVTSLPANPVDGQECYFLADATNGVVWHLRYRAAAVGVYKWEYVGGPALRAEVLTKESTGSTVETDLTTVGPSVVLPLAGDYEVGYGAGVNPAAGAVYAVVTPKFGAAAVVGTDAIVVYTTGGAAELQIARWCVRTGLGAGITVKLSYRMSGSTGGFNNRWIMATPVRVG